MANYEVVLGRAVRDLVRWSMDLEEEEGRSAWRVLGLLFWAVAQKHRGWRMGLQGWMAVAPRSRAICKASLAMTVAIKLERPSITLVYDESFKHRAPAALSSRQIEMSGITFSPRQ